MLEPNWLTSEADARRRQIERERHQYGRIHTVADRDAVRGSMPSLELIMQPRDYDTAFGYRPWFTYVTADEYETMRNEWRLQTGEMYIVMS